MKKLDKFELRRLAKEYARLLKIIEILEEFKYSMGGDSFTPLINELFFGGVYYMSSLFNRIGDSYEENKEIRNLFLKYYSMEENKKEFKDFETFNKYFESLLKDFEIIKRFVEMGEI